MASFRKIDNKWLAEVRTKGIYRSKRFPSKVEAQRWALDLEQQLGKNPKIAISRTFGEALDKYAEEVSPSKKGARWEIIRIRKIKRDPIANIIISSMRREDIEAWMRRQTVSPASVNRELNLISAVFRHARVKWQWITENPMADLEWPKKPPHRDRLLYIDEIKRILLALNFKVREQATTPRQQLAVAFLLALETGMRQGEIWGLDWKHINLGKRYLHLPDTKNSDKRDVPLSKRAIRLLRKMEPKPAGRLFQQSQNAASAIFTRTVRLAEIENLTFHDTRHSATTRLSTKLDVLALARMIGHRDIRSLMIYYNARAEDIAKRLG